MVTTPTYTDTPSPAVALNERHRAETILAAWLRQSARARAYGSD